MKPKRSSWHDRVRDPALTVMLIVLCLIIFIAAPFAVTDYQGSRLATELLFCIFALLVVIISRGRIVTLIATLSMIASLVGISLTLASFSNSTRLLAHIGNISGTVVVAYVVGRAVFGPGAITAHRVLGAIVLYLDFGIMCSSGYRLIWDLIPNSLTGVPEGATSWQAAGSILYFSFTALTTIGFGDIVPVHPAARALTNLEGIFGQLYPATLLARLITLELEDRRR